MIQSILMNYYINHNGIGGRCTQVPLRYANPMNDNLNGLVVKHKLVKVEGGTWQGEGLSVVHCYILLRRESLPGVLVVITVT